MALYGRWDPRGSHLPYLSTPFDLVLDGARVRRFRGGAGKVWTRRSFFPALAHLVGKVDEGTIGLLDGAGAVGKHRKIMKRASWGGLGVLCLIAGGLFWVEGRSPEWFEHAGPMKVWVIFLFGIGAAHVVRVVPCAEGNWRHVLSGMVVACFVGLWAWKVGDAYDMRVYG
ncbi:MAG: hypothetical protein ABJE95_39610, partial [Byssovorax sp.]